MGYEGNAFSSSGSAVEDLLNIAAVHPMREEAVQAFVDKARIDWTTKTSLWRLNTTVKNFI